MNMDVAAKIRQRRLQILVHSCIYYEFDTNIVSDAQWGSWAKELISLQQANPQEAASVDWAKEFQGFDGSTGMDLPTKDPWVINKAMQLLHYKGELGHGGRHEVENDKLLPCKPVKKGNVKRRKLF